MLIAAIAAACMVVTDLLATIMVMAEAKERGWLAGFLDMAGWYVSIASTSISVTTLAGHNTTQKIWVLILVGLANVFGTKLGQVTGSHLLKSKALRGRLAHAEAFTAHATVVRDGGDRITHTTDGGDW